MENFYEILDYKFWGDSVHNYLIAVALFVAILLATRLFKTVVVSRLKKLSKKTDTGLDDALIESIDKIYGISYLVLALYFPLRMILPSGPAEDIVHGVFVVVMVFELVRFVIQAAEYLLKKSMKKPEGEGHESDTAFHGLSLIIKIVLWTTGILLVLSNLGVNISTFLASLGIGGIAVALAVQNILGDMFSSFSIYFDKPFKIGDFITVGQDSGTVKKIGLKTTRLRTLQGEELVISNHELTNSRVQNFKKLKERRVIMHFSLMPNLSNEKIKKVPSILEKILDGIEEAKFERAHFSDIGEHGLNFEVIYYVLTADYSVYMNIKQDVNLAMKKAFEEEGIELFFTKALVV